VSLPQPVCVGEVGVGHHRPRISGPVGVADVGRRPRSVGRGSGVEVAASAKEATILLLGTRWSVGVVREGGGLDARLGLGDFSVGRGIGGCGGRGEGVQVGHGGVLEGVGGAAAVVASMLGALALLNQEDG